MDDVEAEQQRDLQPRLQRQRLDLARVLRALHVQHRPHIAGLDGTELAFALVAFGAGGFAAGQLVQLADLFLQRHLLEQRIHLVIDLVRACQRREQAQGRGQRGRS